MSRLVLAGIAVAAAFAVLLSFAPWQNDPEVAVLPPALEEEPDLYMRQATISQHLVDGTMEYELRSQEIQHFESSTTTRLNEPHLTLYTPPDPPWQVTSRRGTIGYQPGPGGDEEVVKLREEVVLVQTISSGQQMTLYTSALDIYPDRQYAESDQDVMIDSAMSRFHSAGIKSNLKAGSMSLFASDREPVRTVIQP